MMPERDDEPTQVTRILSDLTARVEACVSSDRASIREARAARGKSTPPRLSIAASPLRPSDRLRRLADRAEELTREIVALAIEDRPPDAPR